MIISPEEKREIRQVFPILANSGDFMLSAVSFTNYNLINEFYARAPNSSNKYLDRISK